MLKMYFVDGMRVIDFGESKGIFRFQEVETARFWHKLPSRASFLGEISENEAFELMMEYDD